MPLILLLAAQLPAAAFPVYTKDVSFRDQPTTETWVLYPFYHHTENTSGTVTAIHPFLDWYTRTDTGERGADVLLPFYTWRYRPQTAAGARDYERHMLLPLYFQRRETRAGREVFDRMLIPFWFQGHREGEGNYNILFPFIWSGYNAKFTIPGFPERPQTFAALWPLIGDFRGFWNRDRIAFFLWPIFVYSNEGTEEDYNEAISLVWPVTGYFTGPKVSGFRLWPLYATVKKEGEFQRSYFLWPLGARRTGQISKKDTREQDLTLFIPFYGRVRRPDFEFDMLFPFHGRLVAGQREVQGYALGLWNRDTNHRRGVRETRWFWFIVRDRESLPGHEQNEQAAESLTGGGVFPVYTVLSNESKYRQTIAWPIYTYKTDDHDDYRFEREYVIPFYSSQRWKHTDGTQRRRSFYFPFFRRTETRAGQVRRNSLHLWFHSEVESIDRLYAPFWEFWKTEEDQATGEKSVRWFQQAYAYDRRSDGAERSRLNLLFFEKETFTRPDGEIRQASTQLFWGLLGRHRRGETTENEILWMRF